MRFCALTRRLVSGMANVMSRDFFDRLRPLGFFIAGIWAIQLVNWLLGHSLNPALGLEPRDVPGLIGIPFMPLLHGSWGHLIANTAPLLVLGGVALIATPDRFLTATAIIILTSGLAVWIFARSGIVVGASGLVFGWFGYLVAAGVLYRSPRAILGAVIALVFYGGLIWGVLPQRPGISWEAHLFGALAGAATAWLLRAPRKA